MNEIRRAPPQSKNLTPNVWAPARALAAATSARRASRARTCACTPSSGLRSRPQGNRPTSRREHAYSRTRTCMFTITNMHVHDCGYACSQTAPTTRGQTPTRLYFNAETQSRRVSRGGKVGVGARVFPHFGRAACPQAAAAANRGRLRTIAPTSSAASTLKNAPRAQCSLKPRPVNWATARPVSSEMSTFTTHEVRPSLRYVARAVSRSPFGAAR